jgi:hypothetical protein
VASRLWNVCVAEAPQYSKDEGMSSIDEVKAEIKKLSSKATNMKLALHDLSEDLPINWNTIMTVAQQTHDAYAALETARQKLKALEDA